LGRPSKTPSFVGRKIGAGQGVRQAERSAPRLQRDFFDDFAADADRELFDADALGADLLDELALFFADDFEAELLELEALELEAFALLE
jgi:hypothetical protein